MRLRRSPLLALGIAIVLEACVLFVPSVDVGLTCHFDGDRTACGRCVATVCVAELGACCLDDACGSALSDLTSCTGGACGPLGVDERAAGAAGSLAVCVARACASACGGADAGLDLDAAGVGDGGHDAAADAAGDGGAQGDGTTDAPATDAAKDGPSDSGPVLYCSQAADLCACRATPFDASAPGAACNPAFFGGTPSQVSCCATADWPASGKCSCVPMACEGVSTTLCTCVIAPLDAGNLTSCTGTCCLDDQYGTTCACAPQACPSGYSQIPASSCTGDVLRCPSGQSSVTTCTP
jgi:hypothetical protein